MSKRRELRQTLYAAKVALEQAGGNEELVEDIRDAMERLASPQDKAALRVEPPRRGDPLMAILQCKVFPLTEEVCYQGIMFGEAEGFWRFFMEQAQGKRAFAAIDRPQQYIMPAEIREFLASGGKITREEPKVKLATKTGRSLEDLGL